MQTTIRMPNSLHKILKKEAEEKGMTFNGYLLKLLWDYVGKRTD